MAESCGGSLHSALGHCDGSVAVATRLRCGAIFNYRFIRNLLLPKPAGETFENRLAKLQGKAEWHVLADTVYVDTGVSSTSRSVTPRQSVGESRTEEIRV